MMLNEFCHHHDYGVISKISGSRIYFDRVVKAREDDEEDRIVAEYCLRFAAICDTDLEIQSLIAFDREAEVELRDLMRSQRTRWRAMFV
jgi:hypothetical protein